MRPRSTSAPPPARARHTSKKSLISQVEACKRRIGVERDKLRELLDDADAVWRDCENAHTDLERVVDDLSKYL